MPKITRHGGPSIAGASVVAGGWSNEGDPNVWPEPEQTDDETPAIEGSEQPSAGSNSQTSPEKPDSEPETKPTGRRKPVRTTGSRSTRARTENSSVRGMAGDREDGTSAVEGSEG